MACQVLLAECRMVGGTASQISRHSAILACTALTAQLLVGWSHLVVCRVLHTLPLAADLQVARSGRVEPLPARARLVSGRKLSPPAPRYHVVLDTLTDCRPVQQRCLHSAVLPAADCVDGQQRRLEQDEELVPVADTGPRGEEVETEGESEQLQPQLPGRQHWEAVLRAWDREDLPRIS